MKIRCFALAVSLLTGLVGSSGSWASEPIPKKLIFGVVPQQSASRLAAAWIPFLNEVSARSGIKFTFATAKDIPTFEACLLEGKYDAAYMNPYHYVFFSGKSGYRAIARRRGSELSGILVAARSRTVRSLDDLDGHQLAFPSPAAFGASLLIRAELKQRGINFDPVYVNSHDSVYLAVAEGLYPAGGGVRRTLKTQPAPIKDNIEVIYETGKYTPHAIAVAPRITPEITLELQKAIDSVEEGHRSLKGLAIPGFTAAVNKDWDDVRSLNLDADGTEIVSDGSISCHSG